MQWCRCEWKRGRRGLRRGWHWFRSPLCITVCTTAHAPRWACYLILISATVRTDTLKTRLPTKSRRLHSVFDKPKSCGVRLPGFKFQLSHVVAMQPSETLCTPRASVSSQGGIIRGALSEGGAGHKMLGSILGT